MVENAFCRTEYLIGQEALQKLKNAKVAIFGIGGVGSYVVEALARVGIGSFVLVDKDAKNPFDQLKQTNEEPNSN